MFDLLQRRLIWVGGKGGVGKTTVSASLAVLAASRGQRCLVVSTDPAHSLGDVFARQLDDTPQRLLPNLDAMEIDPDIEVEAHLKRVTEQMRRFAAPEMMKELQRQMQLTRQSPGTQEAALLERIARLINDPDSPYDLIIFDTAPVDAARGHGSLDRWSADTQPQIRRAGQGAQAPDAEKWPRCGNPF